MPATPPARPPRRFRFGLFSLLLVITLFSVASALLGHLLREGADSTTTALFLLLACAAPMGLMIAVSVAQYLAELLRRKPK